MPVRRKRRLEILLALIFFSLLFRLPQRHDCVAAAAVAAAAVAPAAVADAARRCRTLRLRCYMQEIYYYYYYYDYACTYYVQKRIVRSLRDACPSSLCTYVWGMITYGRTCSISSTSRLFLFFSSTRCYLRSMTACDCLLSFFPLRWVHRSTYTFSVAICTDNGVLHQRGQWVCTRMLVTCVRRHNLCV